MKTKLIQLLDCEGDPLALFSYNGDLMSHHEATKAIDKAYGDAREVLLTAGQDLNDLPSPGDVEGDAEEALAAIGIERIYVDTHYSEHF